MPRGAGNCICRKHKLFQESASHGGGGKEEGGVPEGNKFPISPRNNKMYTALMQSAQLRVTEEMGKHSCWMGMKGAGQDSSRAILFAKTLGSHRLMFLLLIYFSFNFKKMFIYFEREREREIMSGGGAERTILHCQHRA